MGVYSELSCSTTTGVYTATILFPFILFCIKIWTNFGVYDEIKASYATTYSKTVSVLILSQEENVKTPEILFNIIHNQPCIL